LAALIASAARGVGLGPDLTQDQMAGLAQMVRDDDRCRPLSAETEQAVRAALQEPLTEQNDPKEVAEALFSRLPDRPMPVEDREGRRYALVAVPM
jgi:hypothetical protein